MGGSDPGRSRGAFTDDLKQPFSATLGKGNIAYFSPDDPVKPGPALQGTSQEVLWLGCNQNQITELTPDITCWFSGGKTIAARKSRH